jgi:hypothetical protein
VRCIVEEFGDGIGELVYWLTDTGQGEGDILARTTAWCWAAPRGMRNSSSSPTSSTMAA